VTAFIDINLPIFIASINNLIKEKTYIKVIIISWLMRKRALTAFLIF